MEWIGLKPNPGKRLGIRAVLAFTSLPELHKEAATQPPPYTSHCWGSHYDGTALPSLPFPLSLEFIFFISNLWGGIIAGTLSLALTLSTYSSLFSLFTFLSPNLPCFLFRSLRGFLFNIWAFYFIFEEALLQALLHLPFTTLPYTTKRQPPEPPPGSSIVRSWHPLLLMLPFTSPKHH